MYDFSQLMSSTVFVNVFCSRKNYPPQNYYYSAGYFVMIIENYYCPVDHSAMIVENYYPVGYSDYLEEFAE